MPDPCCLLDLKGEGSCRVHPPLPPAPEGQESRWFREHLEECEWPETTCPTPSVLCQDCPYYRPKQEW